MVQVGGKGEDDHPEADHDSLFLRIGGVCTFPQMYSDSGRVQGVSFDGCFDVARLCLPMTIDCWREGIIYLGN